MKKILSIFLASLLLIGFFACTADEIHTDTAETVDVQTESDEDTMNIEIKNLPAITAGETAGEKSRYTDEKGDTAVIPKGFTVSEKENENIISAGLVVTGPDGSEFVWIPTSHTSLAKRDFGSYIHWATYYSDYWDDTTLEEYKKMVASTEQYGGGSSLSDYVPASKRITDDGSKVWVKFSPQKATVACRNMYADNETVQGFFPWGINYDTTLQWLIDSGCKTKEEISRDSTFWGNYSNDTFSHDADGRYTGKWEEANTNNIYDLAGNNWEWTQERYGADSYVMRGGGYNIMFGPCRGSDYPAAIRDPLPGNDRHPNVTFRVALYIK